jgi:hypothetical protein
VAELNTTSVAAREPKLTSLRSVRSVPVMVTEVPPGPPSPLPCSPLFSSRAGDHALGHFHQFRGRAARSFHLG